MQVMKTVLKPNLLCDTMCPGDFGFWEDGVNILFPAPPATDNEHSGHLDMKQTEED